MVLVEDPSYGQLGRLLHGTETMASLDDCQERRQKILTEQDEKADGLNEFLSRLRVREDKSEEYEGHDAVLIQSDVGNNFEERIRDCGGGKTYLYAPILPLTQGLVRAVVFSAWDNVVGPKAVFVWTTRHSVDQKHENVPQQAAFDVETAIQYTVSHTLHGELGKLGTKSGGARGHELYVAHDSGFMVYSVPFSAPVKNTGSVPHSLAIIIPSSRMRRYLDLQSLFNLWMQRLACCLKVFLYQKDYKIALTELTPTVVEFVQVLSSLNASSLAVAESEMDIVVERDALKPLMEKAVTSHLQTCCCSLVIGDNSSVVNCMVRLLANFLRPRDQCLVRLAMDDSKRSWPYHPGLLIQGMTKGPRGEAEVSAESILCSAFPTTIVDLSQAKVLRSWLLHDHTKHRKARFKQELSALLTGAKPSPAMTQNIFSKVTDVSPLVREFLDKIWSLECDFHKRRNLVSLFLRQLEYHALALIKLIQSQRRPSVSVEESAPQQPINKRNLRRLLDLEDEADFLVVLAVGDKLCPGLYGAVMRENGEMDREFMN